MMSDGYHSTIFLQTAETGIFDGEQVTRTSKYKISQLSLVLQ
jgi:hypothetical protein